MSETVINRPAKIKAHNTLKGKGLKIERIYTTEGVHPYDQIKWERRDVVQQNWKTGETVFEQRGVEYPDSWSVNASTIVTTKYFRGAVGAENREWSLKQVIDRVVLTYTKAGKEHGYFATDKDAEIFRARANTHARSPNLLIQLTSVVQRWNTGATAGFSMFHLVS